ncbi:MAG: LemA family protein [Chitinophagaceae bacterium]|jgi:LemA protein|nr:LemA family protein [Chitinophagaceae bacterium]
MKTKNLTLIIIVGVILVLGGCAACQYNSLVGVDNNVDESWGNVQASYQRRTDLYNSVIKTVEASANFEKSTLKEVTEARAKATQIQVNTNDPASLAQFQQAQAQLQGSMSRLIASFEAYPQLKTTEAFMKFQDEIAGTENRINRARSDYNNVVKAYNAKVRTFPNNIFAGMFGFPRKPFYEADAASQKAPDINFNIK